MGIPIKGGLPKNLMWGVPPRKRLKWIINPVLVDSSSLRTWQSSWNWKVFKVTQVGGGLGGLPGHPPPDRNCNFLFCLLRIEGFIFIFYTPVPVQFPLFAPPSRIVVHWAAAGLPLNQQWPPVHVLVLLNGYTCVCVRVYVLSACACVCVGALLY